MGLTTSIIRYNVTDRGRQFQGSPRNFNVKKLVQLVNGNRVQEMVKKGDLHGYLGHDIRRKFGLYPPETAIENGQIIPLEPAFITVHLKAYNDGTIEHKARFLDTPLGKVAQQWHETEAGGFSSVIAPSEENPEMFWGFDYVKSPNFHGNRGYVMDSLDVFNFELNRLTSKQKALFMQGQQEEREAVMDALFSSYKKMACDNADLKKLTQQLSATVDFLGSELESTQDKLNELQVVYDNVQPKYEPMARLSVAEDNWLLRGLAVMDDISSTDLQYKKDDFIQSDFASELLKGRLK